MAGPFRRNQSVPRPATAAEPNAVYDVRFPQLDALTGALTGAAGQYTQLVASSQAVLAALADLRRRIDTMATNQDRLTADESRLQGIVAGEAADIAGIKQVQQSNATAIQALRDQLTAAGIDPATLGAIEDQLTTLEGNNQTLADLGGGAPAPATTPPADPTAPTGP